MLFYVSSVYLVRDGLCYLQLQSLTNKLCSEIFPGLLPAISHQPSQPWMHKDFRSQFRDSVAPYTTVSPADIIVFLFTHVYILISIINVLRLRSQSPYFLSLHSMLKYSAWPAHKDAKDL